MIEVDKRFKHYLISDKLKIKAIWDQETGMVRFSKNGELVSTEDLSDWTPEKIEKYIQGVTSHLKNQ